MEEKKKHMSLAIKEAQKAFLKEELPIGAVLVLNNKIIKAHNKRNKSNRIIDHAELIVISKANKKIKNWRLIGATIFVSLEPCPMCASAIAQSRIKKVIVAASSTDVEQSKITKQIFNKSGITMESGILKEESEELLSQFFKNKRP